MFDRKKVGVALCGGGMRGLAHVGVLKVLEEYRIPIDMISGTSMGAMIAAMYALEPNAVKLEKEVRNEDIKSLFDYTISKYGVVKGKKIENYLQKKLSGVQFDELKIPAYITAYDITNNREIIFHKGDVAKAVRASIAIPGVFFPVENDNAILVDGGIVDPIPTEILRRAGAEIVIAVNVNPIRDIPMVNKKAEKLVYDKQKMKKFPSLISNIIKTMDILNREVALADLRKEKGDLIITVPLEGVGVFDFAKKEMIIQKGKAAARKSIRDLKNITSTNPLKNLIAQLDKLGISPITKGVEKVIEVSGEGIKQVGKQISKI